MKNKKYILITISAILYVYLMFFSNINLGTGKKELENILVLAIPCLLLFVNSLGIKEKEERKKYLYCYLVMYILAMLGFTFSDNRLFWKRLGDITFVREYNLIPFKSMFQMLNSGLGIKVGLYNIIGNFLMLTPLSILLPMISETFKKVTKFMVTILSITISIELIQFLTCSGSFDIDDIILNFGGAAILYLIIVKTKLFDFVYKIFYDLKIKKKIITGLKITLIGGLIFVYGIYFISIYETYKASVVEFSSLKCIDNQKTFITRLGDSNYYSNCKYEGYVIVGDRNVQLDDYLKSNPKEKYLEQLGITKKKWLLNIEIKYNDNKLKLLNSDDRYKLYFYGIESMKLLVDYDDGNGEREIIITDNYPEKSVGSLLEIVETGIYEGNTYAIFKGDYYNQIGCSEGKYSMQTSNYILPKDYKISKEFCSAIKNES